MPKVHISGRIDPKSAAVAATFLKQEGWTVSSRSELVHACIEMVAAMGGKMGIAKPEYYETAFDLLEELGMVWEGARAESEKLTTLKHDALNDLDKEEIKSVRDYIKQLRFEKEKEEASALLSELQTIEEETTTSNENSSG